MANPKKIKKIEKFVGKHFPDATCREVSEGREYRFLCPFCRGGQSREVSFDLNPVSGACRCWRASCGWKSSIEWFVKNFLNVSYPRAVEIIGTGEATSVEELVSDLNMLESHLNDCYKPVEEFADNVISAWVEGSVRLDESELSIRSHIKKWIEQDRGYCFDEFVEDHDLWVPPQFGAYKGRILFSIECEDSLGYLLYAFDPDVKPKTLNPSGKVLSNMLYRYDEISTKSNIFICEGIFDAARLISWGYAATCLFTTYISDYQCCLLSRADAEEITFVFDHGDGISKLAREAALSLNEYCCDKVISVIDICEDQYIGNNWKDGMDPDDLEEEEFLEFFKHRVKILSKEDRLRLALNRAKQG